MGIATLLAASVSIVCVLIQLASVALALPRCSAGRRKPRSKHCPPVTIVRPVCGLEPFSESTLGATFDIEWPVFEIIFCVDDPADPIIDVVTRLIASKPHSNAILLIGRDHLSNNPKLNNMAKGWRRASHEWIVFLDSNILPPVDYLHRLFLAQTGANCMVSAPPAGTAPAGFWSEVECSLLNALQARFQYAAYAMGMGFAQGKTLFFARSTLDNGGFEALGMEPAEDAAATKLMRKTGGKVCLAEPPFPQPLGRKTFNEVFERHVRWARLRRSTFPELFLPEIALGAMPPLLALTVWLYTLNMPVSSMLAIEIVFAALWYMPELALTYAARWPLNWRTPFAFMVRDVLLPVIYLSACLGKQVVWKGVAIPAGRQSRRDRDGNGLRGV